MTEVTHTFNDDKFPVLTKEHIDSCKYSSWYPKFEQANHACVVKSHILYNIPDSFIQFLLEDGIKLKSHLGTDENSNDGELSDWSSTHDSDASSSTSSNTVSKFIDPEADFPEVDNFISQCFSKTEKLTPRFNWSAPKDSVWILPYNNTMSTYTNEDVYLLLKSSNCIMHDMLYPYENLTETPNENVNDIKNSNLILREWIEDLNPSLEFRCFIMKGRLIGISQRDVRTEYCYLNDIKQELETKIDNFVQTVFKPTFFLPDQPEKENAVIDIYVDKNTIKLIDVNPFCRSTDSLLFSWNELITMNNKKEYEFRLGQNNTKLGSRDYTENQVPLEIFSASLDPEKLRELTFEWSRLLKKQVNDEEHQ